MFAIVGAMEPGGHKQSVDRNVTKYGQPRSSLESLNAARFLSNKVDYLRIYRWNKRLAAFLTCKTLLFRSHPCNKIKNEENIKAQRSPIENVI